MLQLNQIALCFTLVVAVTSSVLGADIPQSIQKKLSELAPGKTLPVVIHFTERPDLTLFPYGKKSAPEMIQYLKHLSRKNIGDLKSILSQRDYSGKLTPLWITNSVALEVTETMARSVMSLPIVRSMEEEEHIVTDGSQINFSEQLHSIDGLTPPWNISIIKADSVWQQYGITGAGVLIGSMDSGVDTTHQALFSKWKGGAHSWFDAINGNSSPYDDLGHGTHTTGTLVGGDGAGPDDNDVGVAYGAQFIAAKMISSGFSTNAQVIGAAQWMLDPDDNPATNDFPDVINNSWFSNTRGSTWFYDAAAAWRAAGIIPVFCAANFGPATESTRSPGDYAICISVGGTNSADNRYGSTSVGPSPIGSSFPTDRRKPDVSAPGEGVYSSFPGGFYATSSGTSMSAPHVAGTVALMLQANADLAYNEILDIIKTTSDDKGAEGYDYVFGYGRINALEAVKGALRYRMNVQPQVNLITYESGDTIMFTVRLRIPPAGSVYVHLSLSDTTEGELISAPLLTFTPEYWDVPQTIVIRGKGDSIADGDVEYLVQASTQSTDLLYDQLSMSLKTITNIDVPVLNVGDENESGIRGYQLRQNYPNPFNPVSNIEFRIAKYGRVNLKIFDVLGREVVDLIDEKLPGGLYSIKWDANGVPSGMYYYRLTSGSFSETKKMMLIK